MITVCHVQVLPILAGAQRAMLEMFAHLDSARYQLHVACQGAGPLTAELDRRGIAWHAVPQLDRPLSIARDRAAYHALHALFARHRFDMVHTHSSKAGWLGRRAAHAVGVPWVIHHVHAFAFHARSNPLTRPLYRWLERRAAPWCQRMIFVNEQERQLALHAGWTTPETSLTVYNGVDLKRIRPCDQPRLRARQRAAWGLDDDQVAILFAGRLDYPKQPHLLPRIAAQLARWIPEPRWRMLIAGDGPQRQRVERESVRQRVVDRVSMLGWQDHREELLAGADVVVLPSLAEGLPLSLVEAHAAGLPCVASDVKGNREVVTRETGVLVAPRQAEGYAQALAALVASRALRKTLGFAARRRAKQQFDATANYRRVAALYDELSQEAGAARARRAA